MLRLFLSPILKSETAGQNDQGLTPTGTGLYTPRPVKALQVFRDEKRIGG
jgi:hypothetical protein